MSGIDAAGEIIGGGLAGRAIEHEVSTDDKGGSGGRPPHCLNCGAPLTGDFCANCGQKGYVHRTLGGLLHDIVHGVLHLDGKFWNTLPLLVWRPGKLTRDYIDGHRARYISPIAFYLFTVVAMFALVVSIGNIAPSDVTFGGEAPADTIEEQRERVAGLETAVAELEGEDRLGMGGMRDGLTSALEVSREQLEAMEAEEAGIESDAATADDLPAEDRSPSDRIGDNIERQFDKAKANPALFLYKVQTTSYKLSWLLIPLSLPFMWLLFPFSRKFRMYDHAVFVTYSISFMMLMVIVIGLIAKVMSPDFMIAAAFFYAPFHLYRQLKGTYGLGRLSALLRTAALSVITWTVLGIFVGIMFTLGALN